MLSSEYIHEKILDTTSCTSEDVKKLAELMELYPYVSSFPILYLKALANSKDVRLESEIEKYAYRITSRAVLYELLNPSFTHPTIERPAPIEILEEVVPAAQTETPTEIATESPQTAPIAENEVISESGNKFIENELETTAITETEETVIEAETTIETPKSEEIHIPEVVESPIVTEIPETNLEDQETETILELKSHTNANSKIDEEVQKIETSEILSPVEEAEIAEIEQEIVEEKEIEETPINDSETIVNENEEIPAEKDELEQLIQSSALSSNYIVSNFSEEENKNEQEVPEIEISTEKINKEIPTKEISEKEQVNARSFSSWLSFGATKEPEIVTPTIEEKTTEIEPEPKKTEYYNFDKPKKEFYSPVKKAKESLSENNMPVSETLAKIFALQGNYPKSIYVYEQLILIFPEKKSFFATQIKNLKKKLNS
jgi:hypothetical protein